MTTTSAVSSTSTVAAKTSQSSIDKLSGNFDTFLKLLTTQLQNQDPTKPMDSNEFTQQLVQYSQVEQQIKTNDQLKSMVSNMQQSASVSAVNYLGKDVQVDGTSAPLANGEAQWSYNLPGAAAKVQLTVKDPAGKTIRFMEGDATAGTHAVKWDGRDNSNNKVADGQYTLSITATDAAGGPLAVSTKSTGRVDSVTYDANGIPSLIIGGRAYQTSSIVAVQAQAAAAASSAAN